jgi:hypothetical protein
MLDILFTASQGLEAPKIIEKYFIFKIMEFKKYRKEIEENPSEKEECKAREATRRIIKSMK